MSTAKTPRSFVNLDAIDDREIRHLVAEYAADLTDRGTVASPGKFEAEPIHVVYYWGWLLQGEGETSYLPCDEHEDEDEDEDCDCELEEEYTQFHIDASDAEAFPQLEASIGKYLRLREDSQGYVVAWITDGGDLS